MESGRKTEEEREKGEANNSSVSCDVLYKDIFNLLGFIERLKSEADQIDLDMDKIEKLKLELTFMSTFLQLSNSNLDGFNAKMSRRAQEVDDLVQSVFYPSGDSVLVKYEMDHVVPRVIENIKSCISTHHHSSSSANMTEEQLLELLDLLLVNLCSLPKCCPELIFPLMTQYEIIRNVCGNIRDFHRLKVNGCIEPEIVEYVFPQVQLMAERVGHFCFVLLADLLDVPQLNFKLIHLLVKITPVQLEVILICWRNLKASESEEVSCFIKQLIRTSPTILREYLIHLQEHIVNVVTTSNSSRNIHVMIEFLLIILTDVPNDFIHHDKLFDLLARVGTLTREVSILVRNLEKKSMSEENTSETSYVTLDLLENIKLLKSDLKYVYMKAPDPYTLCFPMSDGLVFMTLLLRELHDFLSSNASSVALIKEEIVHVQQDLEFITSFFLNAKQALNNDMRTQVLDVAYEAEHAINSILVRDHGLSHLVFLLPDTIKKIKLIITELRQTSENLVEVAADISNKLKKTSKSSIYGNIIVGFKEETNMIIRHLTSGPRELDVISIIGGAGSGKTTLAYRVYNDREVKYHFDIFAWCTVDQEYGTEKIWQKIYNQVSGSEAKFSEDKDVEHELRKKLYGKRYLIVLDDLWDTAVFDDISRAFPQLENRSRIILTSRKNEVALHGKLHTDPLNLRLLRPEESWELLEKMIFGEESCPEELKYVGEEIARKCEGLPLVVDVIGGVLARKEREKVLWLEVLHNFQSYKNVEVLMKVTEISYDRLPDNLKLCLLFLASYPKEKNIKISELKILWSAEGLVETTEMRSVEQVMEDYLDKLISSNLVKYFNKRRGREATCRVDNLVHDFCLMKARKEKLFDFISSSAPSSSSSSDLAPRGMSIHWNENCVMFNPEKKNQYAKRLRSLRVYDVQYWKHNHLSYNCHLRHLRLLKSLDLRKIRLTDSFLNEICMLVHLKYLNIQMKAKALPPSFSNLWNLETLVVDNRRSRMVLSPTIWSLAKLCHVSMDNCSVFDSDTDERRLLEEDSKLENLRILNGLSLSCSEDTEDIFKRFPNLRSLTFSIREQWPCSAEEIDFPRLDVLDELEEVCAYFYCAWPNKHTHLCDFLFLWRLKKLNLTRFNLTSNSLSTIGRLPNLEELCLSEAIIQGKKWDMDDESSFEYLKFLRLDKVYFSEWNLQEDYCFPVLEKLHIQRCDELMDIPEDFMDIYSLKCISLWRNPQLEGSALRIKQYVEDMCGEDRLEVILVPYAKSPYKVDI